MKIRLMLAATVYSIALNASAGPVDQPDVWLQGYGEETLVASNPARPNTVVAVIPQLYNTCLVYRSLNGGRSWSVPSITIGACSRPDVAFSPEGRAYIAYVTYDPFISDPTNYIFVIRSDDGGATWTVPSVAFNGVARGKVYDQPRIAASSGGRVNMIAMEKAYPEVPSGCVFGSIYELKTTVTRSSNYASTWAAPVLVKLSDCPDTIRIASTPTGTVSVAADNDDATINFATSSNGGATYKYPAAFVVKDAAPQYGFAMKIGAKGTTHVVYTRKPGVIGYTWSGAPYRSWAAPVTISDTATPLQFAPELTVRNCGGTSAIGVVWEDARVYGSLTDIFYTEKLARNDTVWSPNIRVSDNSHDSQEHIASVNGGVYVTWRFNRGQTVGSRVVSGLSCR
ncbi:MAG: sialidase family protein [Rhodospirillales bacterium]